MRCPRCGHADSKVVDTRSSLGESIIRRRRVCLSCGHRFFTNETICTDYPTVIKRDGREEEFDREKILAGLWKAFKKCPGADGEVNHIANEVVAEVITKFPAKVHSSTVGDIVMGLLKTSAPVAYLRFASVYKNFVNADDFISEFERMAGDGETRQGKDA
jgi:transcriptional repressor NrdR